MLKSQFDLAKTPFVMVNSHPFPQVFLFNAQLPDCSFYFSMDKFNFSMNEPPVLLSPMFFPTTTTLPRFRQVLTGHGELFQLPLAFGIGQAEGLVENLATRAEFQQFGMI